MASGKPIIATRKATHTQVLDDTTAFLVEPERAEMAVAISKVFSEQGQADAKGQAALDLVRQHYSYEVFAQKLLHAYTLAQT